MKKVLVTILMVVSLTSCEIQRANGPKVSDGSLKNEMTDLVMFGTVEPMRALTVILTEGFEKSGRIGTFTHPSFLRWDFVATWLEGGSGKHWSCEASAPVHFVLAADSDFWTISYQGDGMVHDFYRNISFRTTAEPLPDGWHLITNGTVTDSDGYEMHFGTTGLKLSTRITEREYGTDWEYALSDGSVYMTITQDGAVIDAVTMDCTGHWNSTRLDSEYLHYSTARFWQTTAP